MEVKHSENLHKFRPHFPEADIDYTISDKPNHPVEDGTNTCGTALNKEKILGVIVPYRNRKENLRIFLPYIKNHLKQQGIQFKIFIIEQNDSKYFNKSLLMNFGAKYFFHEVDYFCFHDVDCLPNIDVDYNFDVMPSHLCFNLCENHENERILLDTYDYGKIDFENLNFTTSDNLTGGVFLIDKKLFNNFYYNPNITFGYEDVIYGKILKQNKIPISENKNNKYFLTYHKFLRFSIKLKFIKRCDRICHTTML